jgi:hypothetical protein
LKGEGEKDANPKGCADTWQCPDNGSPDTPSEEEQHEEGVRTELKRLDDSTDEQIHEYLLSRMANREQEF